MVGFFFTMELFTPIVLGDDDGDYRKRYRDHIVGNPKDTILQIGISVSVGLVAFLAFCVRQVPGYLPSASS